MTSSAPVPVFPRIASASGACLRDIEGRDYLDLSAGYGSVWLGHQHPAVTTAIERQLRLHAAPGFFEDGTRERAEAALLPLLPSTHVVAGIYSTGMEAVETALRAARAASGRLAVAGFSGSTHGRSLLTGSLGAWEANEIPGVAYRLPAYSVGAEALVAAIEALTAKVELAAILVEPVQMTNGGHALPQAAADALFALAQARGVTVVFDETLTGLYRCGAALYADRLGHVPPLVVMGKGIANGFPAAAVAHHVDYPWERARVRPGSTFWNHPVTCAAIAATLETLEASEPKARVTQIQTVIQGELGDLVLCGCGAMWCLELPNAAQQPAFIARLLDARVVVSYYDRHIRLLPPLMIDPDALALGCARIREAHAATRW